jgi:hypothetical protein
MKLPEEFTKFIDKWIDALDKNNYKKDDFRFIAYKAYEYIKEGKK